MVRQEKINEWYEQLCQEDKALILEGYTAMVSKIPTAGAIISFEKYKTTVYKVAHNMEKKGNSALYRTAEKAGAKIIGGNDNGQKN